jgi:hypothetical protein
MKKALAASFERGQQWLEMRFVSTPAPHRVGVERPADTHAAGRFDGPARFMKVEAAVVPRKTAIVEQSPGLPFKVFDYVLVANVEHGAGRQNRSPVGH